MLRQARKEEPVMKIAISSAGNDLDSQLDPRFGRCARFVIVETEDLTFEVCENQSAGLGGGAGIQSAQFIASKGAGAVITGNCGPNAVQTLNAAGIQLFCEQSGKIRDVVQKFKDGALTATTEANAPRHAGSGEMGMGRGRGMGRSGGGMSRGGSGPGRSQGMGGGGGRSQGTGGGNRRNG
jgi:predicted Fe-Mo cluster-binding NifX family protein